MSWFSKWVKPKDWFNPIPQGLEDQLGRDIKTTFDDWLGLEEVSRVADNLGYDKASVATHSGTPAKTTNDVPSYTSAEIRDAITRRRKRASQQTGRASTNVTGGLGGSNPTLGRSLLMPL